MDDVLQDSGLPPEAVEVIRRLVSGAGYDLDDAGESVLGMSAALSTLRVCDAVRQHRAPRGSQVGRNDPCPCGSGKKHKKCCLKAGVAGPEPARYDPGDPLERADLVPKVYNNELLSQDLNRLEALFCSDAALCKVRFSPEKLMAFLMTEPPGTDDDPEEETRRGEQRVARYLREVEGVAALGNLDRALLRAARDSAHSDADVRSLALGLTLAELAGTADGAGGDPEEGESNPLLSLVFWLTLGEMAAAIQEE